MAKKVPGCGKWIEGAFCHDTEIPGTNFTVHRAIFFCIKISMFSSSVRIMKAEMYKFKKSSMSSILNKSGEFDETMSYLLGDHVQFTVAGLILFSTRSSL